MRNDAVSLSAKDSKVSVSVMLPEQITVQFLSDLSRYIAIQKASITTLADIIKTSCPRELLDTSLYFLQQKATKTHLLQENLDQIQRQRGM